MTRRDPVYWQRLRKDVRSNIAAGFAAVAVLTATISVIMVAIPGSHYAMRANPLYWALMLPAAWWISGLSTFAPRYVRSWMFVLALACLGGGGSVTWMIARQQDHTLWLINFIATLLSAVMSLVFYRGSLVAREGPAR